MGRGRRAWERGSACAWPRWRRSSTAASSNSGPCRRIAGTFASSSHWAMTEMDSNDGRQIRVLVVDDHDVVQWGFRLLLERQPWVERCLAARDGDEALSLAAKAKPHVALVDLFLGGQSGAEICD